MTTPRRKLLALFRYFAKDTWAQETHFGRVTSAFNQNGTRMLQEHQTPWDYWNWAGRLGLPATVNVYLCGAKIWREGNCCGIQCKTCEVGSGRYFQQF